MALVDKNDLIESLRGRVGKLVFKTYKYGTVVSRLPDMSKVKRTRVQKKNSERFMNAVAYARKVIATPALKKQYEKKADKTGRAVYHLALSDYMKNPDKH